MTYYVYHKVKGDRFGGPDYELLATFDNFAKAEQFAKAQPKPKNAMHSVVIRVRRVKDTA
jgi:hypothetical protein